MRVYKEAYTQLMLDAGEYSAALDILGLSETLVSLANLGSSMSELLLASREQDKDLYRALQRLDKDIGRSMNAIRSRLSVLKLERENVK